MVSMAVQGVPDSLPFPFPLLTGPSNVLGKSAHSVWEAIADRHLRECEGERAAAV